MIASLGFIQNTCFEEFERGFNTAEVIEIIVFVLFILMIVPACCCLIYFCLSNRGILLNKKRETNENNERTVELPSRLEDSGFSSNKGVGPAIDIQAEED